MNDDFVGNSFLSWIGKINESLMVWTGLYWWQTITGLFFIGCLISMSPLRTHHEQLFHQIVLVCCRKFVLWGFVIMGLLPFVTLYLYDTTSYKQPGESQVIWITWFLELAKKNWYLVISGMITGWGIRFMMKRYGQPGWSAILRKLRYTQTDEKRSDIRDESNKFHSQDFLPKKYYKKNNILIGLDADKNPLYIPLNIWYETNMQIIGPTRYGKGIIIGSLMDQVINNEDCLFYVDPKKDKFAPHIMYQACQKTNRKFYYLSLYDNQPGFWSPFAGGTEDDGLTRLMYAFGLELTGDPGTDFYKTQEITHVTDAFELGRTIEELQDRLLSISEAKRINAELKTWLRTKSLSSNRNDGFSIAKAIKENAVVYVQGSLDHPIILKATQIFIMELIQEGRRLDQIRKTYLTAIIDEVSFLVSDILSKGLATSIGFRCNFILAYQSQSDLLNLGNKTINAKAIHQSINTNSQIKAIYGGADEITAKWIAGISGTINKEVTQIERTDISSTGGETWQKERMIGSVEENYINTNIALSLPPRVCILIRPTKLAKICHTSFVPVNDETLLNSYLKEQLEIQNTNSKKGYREKLIQLGYSQFSIENFFAENNENIIQRGEDAGLDLENQMQEFQKEQNKSHHEESENNDELSNNSNEEPDDDSFLNTRDHTVLSEEEDMESPDIEDSEDNYDKEDKLKSEEEKIKKKKKPRHIKKTVSDISESFNEDELKKKLETKKL